MNLIASMSCSGSARNEIKQLLLKFPTLAQVVKHS